MGALLTLIAATASAFPSARLVYVRGQGAESCPGEIELRLSVAHRLGYDPFHTGSRRTIMAVVEQSGERLTARMELVDEQGVSQGERRLEAAPDRCDDLIRALALSMSIAIDPERTEPARASELASGGASTASASPRNDAPSEPLSSSNDASNAALALRFGLGGQVAIGVAPAPAAGLLLVGSGRHGDVSLGAEFRLDAPASRAVAGGADVESRLVAGALVPCFHYDPGSLCAVGTLGTIQATSDAAASRQDSALYAAAGLRVGTEWRLSPPLVLSTHADLLANLTRPTLELDGASVWKMPTFSGSLGLTLLASFP
jgi:hypothetical protein